MIDPIAHSGIALLSVLSVPLPVLVAPEFLWDDDTIRTAHLESVMELPVINTPVTEADIIKAATDASITSTRMTHVMVPRGLRQRANEYTRTSSYFLATASW